MHKNTGFVAGWQTLVSKWHRRDYLIFLPTGSRRDAVRNLRWVTSRLAGDMLTTGAHTETKRLGNQTAGRQMAGASALGVFSRVGEEELK
jgi:hypothetical protein